MGLKVHERGVLVVGLGFLGAQRAAAAVAARGSRLVGVFDTDASRTRVVAAGHGAVAFHDLATALEFPAVDVVIVATPHANHVAAVRDALDAGKHVLCEKPLAIEPWLARDLAVAADDAGLALATGFNHRFYPPIVDALRIVDDGGIGRVQSMRIQIGHRATPEFLQGWHTNLTVSGGGTLIDNGPHACDLIERCLGHVVAGVGYVRNALDLPLGCESEAHALFRSAEHAVAELRSSWSLESGYLTAEIRGSAGHLRVETAPWRLTGRLADGSAVASHYAAARLAERWYRRRNGCERSLVRELEDYLRGLDGSERVGATGWDGVQAAEMVDAVYRSAQDGREITLAPPLRVRKVPAHAERGAA